MAKEKKIELKRVNINLPVSLIERVKSYGENLGINTTSAYIVLLNEALLQADTMARMPEILRKYDEIKSKELSSKNKN